jgi:dipeptide/tripeptide permease
MRGTFLRWTGHQRAIAVGAIILVAGGIMVYAASSRWLDATRPLTPFIFVAGHVLWLGAFVSLSAFVRCPRCRVRIVWQALSKAPHPHGLTTLWFAGACPFCGFPGAAPDGRQQAEGGITPPSASRPG